jgi:amino acid transporter
MVFFEKKNRKTFGPSAGPVRQKRALQRVMGPFAALLLTLAVLSPGLGVFIVGNDMLHQAGSGAIVCLLAAAGLGASVAALYAELGSAFPHAGAEYTLAGRLLGPAAGFAMLAVYLVALPIGMAVSGLGIADYLGALLPGLGERQIAVPAILGAVLIAACSISLNATVTGLLVTAEVAALAATFATGVIHMRADGLHRLLHPTMALSAGGIGNVTFALLAVTCASGIYALNGYGGVVCFGEEIRNADRNVGRVVYLALATGAAIVVLPLAGVLIAAPDLGVLYRAPAPILDFLRACGGETLGVLVSLSVAGAVFNCMIAIALSFGRMVFASARDQAWPAPLNRLLASLSPRFGSPAVATLALALAALPLCFVNIKILIMINGNLNIAVYGVMAVCVIAGRRSGRTAHSRARAPWHPLAPVIVLVAMAALTVADLMDPESGRPALLAGGLVIGVGALYAACVARWNKAWRQRDEESPDPGSYVLF